MTALAFSCLGVRTERYSLNPSLIFRVRIAQEDPAGGAGAAGIHAVALTTQIRVEPRRREYTDAEAERLMDLFGERSRWADTMQPLQFATVAAMVPGFEGAAEVDVTVPCTTDLEVAAGRYFEALDDGEAPLLLLFSGTVFAVPADRSPGYEVTRIPWSAESLYRLPVRTWTEMVALHFPDRAWIPLDRPTLDALIRYKNARALPTWNHVMESLLSRPAVGS
jgi:hypothetical protein